jgi:hypothetical protein
LRLLGAAPSGPRTRLPPPRWICIADLSTGGQSRAAGGRSAG